MPANALEPLLGPVSALWRRLLPAESQRRYLLRALLMAIGLRIALFGVMYMYQRVVDQQSLPMADLLTRGLVHWDARHYLGLAEQGYRSNGEERFLIVYFPLYPWLVGLFNFLIRDYLLSGLSVSFLASVGAGYWLQRLLHDQGFDEDTVFRAFAFFSCLPGAIYTVLPFTESLFLALTLWSFAAAQHLQWFRAGLAGALAAATRSTGVLLLPALALAALWPRRGERTNSEPDSSVPAGFKPGMLWLLLISAGLLAYLILNQVVTGNPFTFMQYQSEHWNQGLIPPWTQVIETVQQIAAAPRGQHRFVYFEARLAALIVGLVLLIDATRRKLPLGWLLYAWMSFFVFICAREAISLPRYLYCLFPLYVVLAQWTRRPMLFQAALSISGILLAGWFVLYMTGTGAM